MATGKRVRAKKEARGGSEAALRRRVAALEQENRRLQEEYVSAQSQGCEFLALYSALASLHGALKRHQVLAAVEQIVIDVVGSEQLALFEVAPDGRTLLPCHACGDRALHLGAVTFGSGPIGRAAATGALQIASDKKRAAGTAADPPTACVPLKLGGRVAGVLAIFELFDHKPGLTALDRELFGLLERHVAPALQAATLHARAARTE